MRYTIVSGQVQETSGIALVCSIEIQSQRPSRLLPQIKSAFLASFSFFDFLLDFAPLSYPYSPRSLLSMPQLLLMNTRCPVTIPTSLRNNLLIQSSIMSVGISLSKLPRCYREWVPKPSIVVVRDRILGGEILLYKLCLRRKLGSQSPSS